MKRLPPWIAFLNIFLLYSCNALFPRTPVAPTATPITYKAVYLTKGLGELTVDDLKAHPEVISTLTFDDFKSHAGSKIALWIDKNAVDIVDKAWLNQPPQKYYPLVLVGYNTALYCFRDILHVGRIEGPYVDWSKEKLEPGFCAWLILVEKTDQEKSRMLDYDQTPTVQDILDVTNPLLEEKQDIQPGE